jgi:hypothetical protein
MATYSSGVHIKIIVRFGCSSDLAQPQSGLAGGPAPGGALKGRPGPGGPGCERGRQAEIDDRERYRRGKALRLFGGGPVRAGAAFASARGAAWNRKEGKLPQPECAVTLANESLSCETGLSSESLPS